VIRTRPNCRNAPSILSIGRIGSQKSEFAQGRCLIENLSELISTLRGPARPMTPLAKHQLAQALHSQLPRCQTRREGSDPGRLRQGARLPPELRHHPPPPRATPTETGAAGAAPPAMVPRSWRPCAASGRPRATCAASACAPSWPLLATIERCGELTLSPPVKTALVRMSAATIDRKARRLSAAPQAPRPDHDAPGEPAQAARPRPHLCPVG